MASYDDLLTNTENLEELLAPAEERVWPPVRRAPSRATKRTTVSAAKAEADPEFLPSLGDLLKLPKGEKKSTPAQTETATAPRNPHFLL